jgi:hypothetical protein
MRTQTIRRTPAACAGAIVGKALEPLDEGTGLIWASVLVH